MGQFLGNIFDPVKNLRNPFQVSETLGEFCQSIEGFRQFLEIGQLIGQILDHALHFAETLQRLQIACEAFQICQSLIHVLKLRERLV